MDTDAVEEELASRLISKLQIIPHHHISLRRNKYRVIRRIARYSCFAIRRTNFQVFAACWLSSERFSFADSCNGTG
jgi:hypothetical protein